MSPKTTVSLSIEQGLSFLAKRQLKDGSFTSQSSPSLSPFTPNSKLWQTTFVPSLILTCLSHNDSDKSRKIRSRLADFLISQKSPHWSFNYWSKDSSDNKTQPYPDDLDDTFCALIALFLHDKEIINQEVMAKTVRILLATETKVGGPYRTWLTPKDSSQIWQDVDLAVNSNVAYFLSLKGSDLPALQAMMEEAITQRNFISPYYPAAHAFIYFLSRAYKGTQQALLLEEARMLNNKPEALQQSICLISGLRLGEKLSVLDNLASKIVKAQQPDGSWAASAFYADPVKNDKLYYNGGPELSTAFAIEALTLYQNQPSSVIISNSSDPEYEEFLDQVLYLADQDQQQLDTPLRQRVMTELKDFAYGENGKSVTYLSYRFNESLVNPLPVSDDFFKLLGLANLYGWLAYTIYDDIIDLEGRPELLPTANFSMRASIRSFYRTLTGNNDFERLVTDTFDEIDAANARELSYNRLQVKDGHFYIDKVKTDRQLIRLSNKSAGHMLPVEAILFKIGEQNSIDYQKIHKALRHYLAARQLQDDIHDWQSDLESGQLTYVVQIVLEASGLSVGRHSIKKSIPDLQKLFWHECLPRICSDIAKQTAAGKRSLSGVAILKQDNLILRLLDGINISTQETLIKQADAKEFLNYYKESLL